jgi:aryl-alcohol dehydrogenase-like predicted oxidoreductase
MDYVCLGNTGLKVSRLCLGAMTYGTPDWRPWVLDEAASRPFIRRALKELTARDQVVIATKAFYPAADGPNERGLSRKHLFDAIDGSLRRLGVDSVDLYQIHRFDRETPVELRLDPEEMTRLEEPYQPHSVLGHT